MMATTQLTRPAPVTTAGPVTGARVIRSEWTKFRSLRSSWWTLAASIAFTVGIGVLVSFAAAGDPDASSVPADLATRSEIGTIFAQLALGTLAVLLMSGEYGTGMIRSSMTVVPRRLPVLWAKLVVYVAVVLPVTMVTSLGTFLLGEAIWKAHGRTPASLSDEHVIRIVVGASLYLTVAGVCALAIGTLLRSTAAGITVVAGLFFVLPTVLVAMPTRIAEASRFLPSNAGAALSRLATSPHSLRPWPGFALLCGYAVVLVAAAAWRLRRTDV
jgi:ABC-type transport system involved in multi-copper enzyme maturation permease subunit